MPSHLIPMVSKESVRLFTLMLKDIDDNAYQLLRAATIPIDINEADSRDYQYLPESTLKNLMEVLSTSMSEDKLGVVFWRSCKENFIPYFLSKLGGSKTLKEALEEFSNVVSQESSGATVYVQEAGNSYWLVREKNGVDEPWFQFAEMFSVLFMCELLRSLTNGIWRPTRIGVRSKDSLPFSKLPSLDFAQFFTERPATAVEIPKSFINTPVDVPASALTQRVPVDLTQVDQGSFIDEFKLAIYPYLPVGKLPIKLAAEILRMNVRTLQRRLKSENVVYKTLIEEMVFEQVCDILATTDYAITDIATKFGYSDSPHFIRSFKRIYGITPQQYRLQHKVSS